MVGAATVGGESAWPPSRSNQLGVADPDPAPGLTAGASGETEGDGAAHDRGAFAAAWASAPGAPHPPARPAGVPVGVGPGHADGARLPAPPAALTARSSCPEGIQSGAGDDHDGRAAWASHGAA